MAVHIMRVFCIAMVLVLISCTSENTWQDITNKYYASLNNRDTATALSYKDILLTTAREQKDVPPDSISNVLASIGIVYKSMGKFQESISVFQQLYDMEQRFYAPDSYRLAETMYILADLRMQQGRLDDSVGKELADVLARVKQHGVSNVKALYTGTANSLIYYYTMRKEYQQAVKVTVELVANCRKLYGENDANTLEAYLALAQINKEARKADLTRINTSITEQLLRVESEKLYRHVLGQFQNPQLKHYQFLRGMTMLNFAELQIGRGKIAEARLYMDSAYQIAGVVTDSAAVHGTWIVISAELESYERNDGQADSLYEAGLAVLSSYGPKIGIAKTILIPSGKVKLQLKKYREAEARLQAAFDIYTQTFPKNHPVLRDVIEPLIELYTVSGRPDKVQELNKLINSLTRPI